MNATKNWVYPKKHVGVSQFSAAIGISKYVTKEELRDRLEKGYYWEGNESTKFGHQKEKLAKYYYTKIKKNRVNRGKFTKHNEHNRLVGIADGLIGENGGLEIKCHHKKKEPFEVVPIDYLIQIAGYLILYDREWWDFMSCCFQDETLVKYKIIRIYREDIQSAWDTEWLPKLLQFIKSVDWVK